VVNDAQSLKRTAALILVGLLTVFLWACQSGPAEAPVRGGTTTAGGAQGQSEGAGETATILERMDEYLENGLDKLDQGAFSEGIGQLVAVLAEAQNAGKSAEVDALKQRAETELGKIRAALALEAGTEWLDDNKNQISGSSIEMGSPAGLNPSVLVTLNFGAGKALVPAAPVFFEFVKGSGLLTSLVNTNDYGQANCAIARLDKPNEETIVRATVVYRVKGLAYTFQGVSRDFVYVPPARKATILVLERAENKVQADPLILDAVYQQLKKISFDFSQYNGVLLGEKFMKVFGGDPAAIRAMGLQKEVSYLVMSLNDCYYINQVELQGKKYNIWKSKAQATTRIIRVQDGKIMYSLTVDFIDGQGGNVDNASRAALQGASDLMGTRLGQEFSKIDAALTQGGK
jgi:hypothetical protein